MTVDIVHHALCVFMSVIIKHYERNIIHYSLSPPPPKKYGFNELFLSSMCANIAA